MLPIIQSVDRDEYANVTVTEREGHRLKAFYTERRRKPLESESWNVV
jgi:hypothetical protein